MSGLLPAAVYGLCVPAGDIATDAEIKFPAALRITMAAIDPTAEPEFSGTAINSTTPRATLKIITFPLGDDDDDDDDDEEDPEVLAALMNGNMEDSEEDSDNEELNGGPSDPLKSKKAREEAAKKALKEVMEEAIDKQEVNGTSKKSKGKAVALSDEDTEMSDDDVSLEDELEEFVVCTLDPTQHYQQPLDITIGEKEKVLFKVSGTHAVYLTGNYVMPVDDRRHGMYDDEDDEEEIDPYDRYDLSPDEDELDDDSQSDELDDIDDPRITELTDEEEAPKLIEASAKSKGKNKRPAAGSDDAEPASLDSIIAKSLKAEPITNGDVKLSKKQVKKLKNNAGQPVATASEIETKILKKEESPGGKKVQFAKNLEQGPSGKSEVPKALVTEKNQEKDKKGEQSEKKDEKATPQNKPSSSSVRMENVKGVTIDVKKEGEGKAAKKGSKIRVRYIGKLSNGKVFDANRKGEPFVVTLGTSDVIEGWHIGLDGIRNQGERRLIIPASLGYGKKDMPGIPKNSQLTFDIKCLGVD